MQQSLVSVHGALWKPYCCLESMCLDDHNSAFVKSGSRAVWEVCPSDRPLGEWPRRRSARANATPAINPLPVIRKTTAFKNSRRRQRGSRKNRACSGDRAVGSPGGGRYLSRISVCSQNWANP
jgi:hypothetical protein